MNNVMIAQIPVPSEILKGDWYGTVYAIDTESETQAQHDFEVAHHVGMIIEEYNNRNQYSVSLREVKRELVFVDERTNHYCTLVQFIVRDS